MYSFCSTFWLVVNKKYLLIECNLPTEQLLYPAVLHEVYKDVNNVLPWQKRAAVDEDVKHQLKRLVDVLTGEDLQTTK